MRAQRILIDGRELVEGRLTGIGRVLLGLVGALAVSDAVEIITLATSNAKSVPFQIKIHPNVKIIEIPLSFFTSEKALSDLTRNTSDFFISPYPKLPLFGCYTKAAHFVHDVLDLTHPAYKRRLRVIFDAHRLRKALKRADLTWYVSSWSMEETKKYAGYIGKNPKVRHNGIDDIFSPRKENNEESILKKYGMEPGYVLVLGNGLPHKNLGAMLTVANEASHKILFVGVSEENRKHWQIRHPEAKALWLSHVTEQDLPAIIRAAFCLAQPSTAEGYGYPPLEAMACGVPAVVSRIPVLVETTGGNALYADANNSMDWIQAFQKLEKKSFYQGQVEKGLKWVSTLLGNKGWQRHILDIAELLSRSEAHK
jgi:glycosyltransferase involved in cell wall biosynthesis